MIRKPEERSIIDRSSLPVFLVVSAALALSLLFFTSDGKVTAVDINSIESNPLLITHIRAALLGEELSDASDSSLELEAGQVVTVKDPSTKEFKQVRVTAVAVNSDGKIISFSADDINEPDPLLRSNGYKLSEIESFGVTKTTR